MMRQPSVKLLAALLLALPAAADTISLKTTAPLDHLYPERTGEYSVALLPYLPPPGVWPQGFVRLSNWGDTDDQAHFEFSGEYGETAWTALVDLPAGQTRGFNMDDLAGRTQKPGITVGHDVGISSGSYTALVQTGPQVFAYAFTRSRVGFITDVSTANLHVETGRGDDPHFAMDLSTLNPGSNHKIVGMLRYVSLHSEQSVFQINGIDDSGTPSTAVHCALPPWGFVDLDVRDLESGELPPSCTGSWGDGTGKWQVISQTDNPSLFGMSFMYSVDLGIRSNVTTPIVPTFSLIAE